MSTGRKSATQAGRDPHLAGAEAAMHRAARRARERAESVAGTRAQDRVPDQGQARRGERPHLDPRKLSFSQAQGYEKIPGPLKLGELPQEARTKIGNLFYKHVSACMSKDRVDRETPMESLGVFDYTIVGPWIGNPWKKIMRAKHVDFDGKPDEAWGSDFKIICSELRDDITNLPFNKVFDMIHFVLRHPECPDGFCTAMKETFLDCRLAYVVDTEPPATIFPAATREEGDSIVESILVLREARLDGSASHLRKASEYLNASDWAGSVRESIHAVESVARQLDPGAAKTLGPALTSLKKRGAVHPALKEAFGKLYGYTSDEQGIRHSLLHRPDANVGIDEAVFMLGACASFASYLWRKREGGERR